MSSPPKLMNTSYMNTGSDIKKDDGDEEEEEEAAAGGNPIEELK